MYIYVDPQTRTNENVANVALANLPADCIVTYDQDDLDKAEIIVNGMSQLTGEMIGKAVNLKCIIRNAVGTDNIDKKAAAQRNIPVYNLPLVNYESVAEMVIGLMVCCGRYVAFSHVSNLQGIAHNYPHDYRGIEIYGKTVGILGFGHIGRRLAEILKTAFHAEVLIYDPYVSTQTAESCGVTKYEDYRDIMREADFISLHTPLTDETRNMINAETLALCKPTAVLINASRAGIVDEDALYEALKEGRLFAAAVDVMSVDVGNKLLSLPNFVGTSHLGGNTMEARVRVGEMLKERLLGEIEKIKNGAE